MRIIFAGTPEFAATALDALVQAGHEVALVLSQPDRPSGRGMKLQPSPVKSLAIQYDLPVLTPQSLSLKKHPEEAQAAIEAMQATNAELLVVAAYGLILPQNVLDIAQGIGVNKTIKALNIHASLLPRWRGAAPIARAIEQGDPITGVTLMKMEIGLDTGPMICDVKTAITPEDTHASLTNRLASLGAQLLVSALEKADTLTCTAQPEEGVCYAQKLMKSEGEINWHESADNLERKLRAFTPFPGLYTHRNNELFKIWEADVVDLQGKPGEVIQCKDELIIACQSQALRIKVAQRPGKPKMPIDRLLQSMNFQQGEVLS